ncbi:unnamed protein product, partial [Didymodactylos carnosus]
MTSQVLSALKQASDNVVHITPKSARRTDIAQSTLSHTTKNDDLSSSPSNEFFDTTSQIFVTGSSIKETVSSNPSLGSTTSSGQLTKASETAEKQIEDDRIEAQHVIADYGIDPNEMLHM